MLNNWSKFGSPVGLKYYKDNTPHRIHSTSSSPVVCQSVDDKFSLPLNKEQTSIV